MKVTKFKNELRKMTAKELREKLDAMRREYFGMRLKISSGTIKDYSLFNKLKKDIARAETQARHIEDKA